MGSIHVLDGVHTPIPTRSDTLQPDVYPAPLAQWNGLVQSWGPLPPMTKRYQYYAAGASCSGDAAYCKIALYTCYSAL